MLAIQTDHQSLSKRFTPLYIAAFLQELIFWYAIEKLFMTSIGFTSETIAVTVIVFTAITLIANIPVGILADRWSRKGVLMLACCCMIVSCVIGGSSHGFWMYLVAACFSGLFYACYQGMYDSVAYDLLMEEVGSADSYERYRGKLQLYDGLALMMGGLASTVITHYLHFRATYFLTIPFAMCSLVALCYFREPNEHKKEVDELIGAHIRSTFRAILHNRALFWIVTALVLISVAMKLLLDFDQLWFIAVALPVAWYGPFDALLLSSFTNGGFISGKIKSDKAVAFFGLLALMSSVLLFKRHSFLIIVAQVVIVSVLVIYLIVFERYLHDALSSRIRVGAASIVATLGGIAFLPIAYLFGSISNRHDIFHATWVIIALLALIIATGYAIVHTQSKKGHIAE